MSALSAMTNLHHTHTGMHIVMENRRERLKSLWDEQLKILLEMGFEYPVNCTGSPWDNYTRS